MWDYNPEWRCGECGEDAARLVYDRPDGTQVMYCGCCGAFAGRRKKPAPETKEEPDEG